MLPLLSSRELPRPVQGECVAAAISATVGLVWLFFSRVYRLGWAGVGFSLVYSRVDVYFIISTTGDANWVVCVYVGI